MRAAARLRRGYGEGWDESLGEGWAVGSSLAEAGLRLTLTGWMMYASPERRRCPRCAMYATWRCSAQALRAGTRAEAWAGAGLRLGSGLKKHEICDLEPEPQRAHRRRCRRRLQKVRDARLELFLQPVHRT